MISVRALATPGPSGSFATVTIERRDPGPHDVLIDIAYAGICHTDVSHARSEWGPTIYPLVPGHEIAGTVAAVGADVARFGVGERVGVGVMVDSCKRCPPCRAGQEQHCREHFVRTYNWRGRDGAPTHGGYSTRIVVDENFVVRVPGALALDRAAPLLCAGITVYSPLRRWRVGRGTRVGVLGLGGLGHVAVQMAAALGARTTVLELSTEKEHDARRLGADEFVVVGGPGAYADLPGSSLDLIISTVPAAYDVTAVLGLLDVEGVLVNLGVSGTSLSVDPFVLLENSRVIAGSSIGGIAETQEMLDFCGEHGIGAWVEVIDGSAVDRAFARLDLGDVRYRFVLDVASIADS
jgi:alcohol dehydrogenase (NADP+)